MRQSIASIAIIHRQQGRETLWLAQWNSKWQRYHFVGGHKHDFESFRHCVIREVSEELGIVEGIDFLLGERPLAHLDYTAWSEGAGQDTHYVMELFEVRLVGEAVRQRVESQSGNRWLTEDEIQKHRCSDGKLVSETMALLLARAELFPGDRVKSRRQVMTKQLRVKNVVVAIVHDPVMRFLLCYNQRWRQYAFPMKSSPDFGDDRTQIAVQALKDHCRSPVTSATATPLEYVGGFGTSWSTGEDTYYNYHVYEVKVDDVASWPVGHVGQWSGFLDYDQLQAAPDELVSWSTKEIARALMEGQKVTLGVICRQGMDGKEFLLFEKASYHGFFFCVARIKTETDPVEAALEAVQSDTGYLGRIEATFVKDVDAVHRSPRYNRHRRYRFFIHSISFPDANLSEPGNPVERALRANGVKYGWFTEDQLANPAAHGLSPTIADVRDDARRACP